MIKIKRAKRKRMEEEEVVLSKNLLKEVKFSILRCKF